MATFLARAGTLGNNGCMGSGGNQDAKNLEIALKELTEKSWGRQIFNCTYLHNSAIWYRKLIAFGHLVLLLAHFKNFQYLGSTSKEQKQKSEINGPMFK